MNGGNRPLVRDEAVEFEKEPVEVQDFMKIIDRSEESMGHTSNR